MNSFFGEDEGAPGFDDFDTSDVDPNKCVSSRTVDKIGKYHFEISKVIPRPDKEDKHGQPREQDINLICVVQCSVAGQSPEGSIYFHDLKVSGKGGGPMEGWVKESTCAFLSGLGLMKKIGEGESAKFVDAATGSTRIDPGAICKKLEGMQFIGDIKMNEWEKDGQPKKDFKLKFGRGAYHVLHPAVADVPKNRDSLAVYLQRTGQVAPQQAAQAAPKAPAPVAQQHVPQMQTVPDELAGL
jgi:hypothetical protein